MAKCQRKQTNVLLAFQVLHFVSQLRRRVQPRVQRGFDDDLRLGNKLSTDREVLRRGSEGLSRLGVRDAKQPQRIANRVCKRRKSNLKAPRPMLRLRSSGSDDPERSNESAEEVQQYVERSFRLVS